MIGEQYRQPGAGALCDLAVLLCRPPMCTTELAALRVTGELTREHQSLIGRESTRKATDQPQVVTKQDEPLDVEASIGHLHSAALPSGERQSGCHRGLHRAAAAQGATAIVDTREKALLEGVGDVGAT